MPKPVRVFQGLHLSPSQAQAFCRALLAGMVLGSGTFGLMGCGGQPVASTPLQSPAATPLIGSQAKKPPPDEPASSIAADTRLPLPVGPGEFVLALPPPAPPPLQVSVGQDAADTLHNLALAPDDLENGWEWAWDVFRVLPVEFRSAYIDQVASVTPTWAWERLDPILYHPNWGSEVVQSLYQRMLQLPLEAQLPRLLRLAKNPTHPCHAQAQGLLQSYFPEVRPGQYDEYERRISCYLQP